MSKGRRKSWRMEQLVQITQHLGHLLESGFSLIPSLHLLGTQGIMTPKVSEDIIRELEGGSSLSAAFQKQGVPRLFVSLLQAAEEHGDYCFGLAQCASYYSAQHRLRKELWQALTYPIAVLGLVGCAAFFLVTVVVPRFAQMYETMGLTLPRYTTWFLLFYDGVQGLLYGGGVGLILFGIGSLYFRHLPVEEKSRRTAWLVSLPFLRSYYALRFTHYLTVQLGSLLRSGLPLLQAIESVEKYSPWYALQQGMRRTKERLLLGHALHQSLAQEKSLFLPSLAQLVALGEESGKVEQSLLTLSSSTEMMIREKMQRFTRLLEPLLIFCIGVVMAGTVIALFLPMLHLVEAI